MTYYEIRNTRTGECFNAYAKSYKEACIGKGMKPKDCKCIYCYRANEKE